MKSRRLHVKPEKLRALLSLEPSSGGLGKRSPGWVLMSKPSCGRKLGPWKGLRN